MSPEQQIAEYVVLWDGATEDGCALCAGEYIKDTPQVLHEPSCPIPVVRLRMIARLVELDPAADSPEGKRLTMLADAQQAYEKARAEEPQRG